MKFSTTTSTITFLIAAASNANAFSIQSTSAPRVASTTTAILRMSTHADTSSMIEEAAAASQKYGASSPEARLAWEAVEEIHSADNSEATKGTIENSEEYNQMINDMEEFLARQRPIFDQISDLATKVKKIKLESPSFEPGDASPELIEALNKAKQLTNEMGFESPDVRVAWDNVEEIASAGTFNAERGAMTEDECLVEATRSACQALEELNRVLEVNKKDGRYSQL